MKLINRIETILDGISPYYSKLVWLFHGLNFIYIILFSLFGVIIIEQGYIKYYNLMIQMFVCIFLLVKFHPFREHTLKEGDSSIIFGSAFFLLFNLGIIQYMNTTMADVEKTLKEMV